MLKQCRKVQYLVIGGGYAGMNALAALKRLDNVKSALCVDINEKPGGAWNKFYSHVRLHTDCRQFGVNMHPWHWKDYRIRASRSDVIEHFVDYVKNELPQGFQFQGNTKCESAWREGSFKVKLKTSEGDEIVEADHLIDASGFNYKSHMKKAHDPLTDKDSQEEVEANDLCNVLSQAGPPEGRLIVIVGGGLTGVDAACYSAEHKNASDEVLLITGRSKFFSSREYITPPIPWSRKTLGEQFNEIALMYDGNNALECLQTKEQHGIFFRLTDLPAQSCLFGFMDNDQKRIINDNCQVIANDHFVCCDGSSVHLNSGKLIQTQKQIIVVNCRSSVPNSDSLFFNDAQLIASDGMVRPGALLGFTGPSAYLYTLLYGLGKLDSIKQWGQEQSKNNLTVDDSCKFILKIVANFLVVMDNLPFKFSSSFKLHGDILFPIPRQLLAVAKQQYHRKTILEKADKLLLPLESLPK